MSTCAAIFSLSKGCDGSIFGCRTTAPTIFRRKFAAAGMCAVHAGRTDRPRPGASISWPPSSCSHTRVGANDPACTAGDANCVQGNPMPVYEDVAAGSSTAVCVVSKASELPGLRIALLTLLTLSPR